MVLLARDCASFNLVYASVLFMTSVKFSFKKQFQNDSNVARVFQLRVTMNICHNYPFSMAMHT